MSTDMFEQNRYNAMVERALAYAQEPALVPARPRRAVRAFAAPAIGALAACLVLFYVMMPTQSPQPNFRTQVQDISDTAIYEALDDWTDEA